MTPMSTFTGPILLSVVLVGALGVTHGVLTDRWAQSGRLEAALAALDRVPTTFGDWVGEDIPIEAEVMTRGGIQGCVHRRYKNSRTGETVSLLLVCGRGGPISVHTPDVCYAGAGYRQINDEKVTELDLSGDGTHTFRNLRFGMTEGSPAQLEIYWAWSGDGRDWVGPDNARLALARLPALYKLYVVREFLPGTRTESSDTCKAFLQQALPDIRQKLTPIAE